MAVIMEADNRQVEEKHISNHSYKIIIVGAGIAGLSAAYHLNNAGETDFIVLEARNRIGGRILSIPFGGKTVELGANWLHGVLGNPLFDFACQNRLLDINIEKRPANVVAVTESGHRVQIDLVEKVYDVYFTAFKNCEEFFKNPSTLPKKTSNLGDQLEQSLNKWLGEQNSLGVSPDILKCHKLLFTNLLSRETCISGCHSLSEVSLEDIGSFEELPGGNVNIPRGFQSVIECMSDKLSQSSILLNHPVKKVSWAENSHANNETKIVCENGEIYKAEHVILTIPLGCLKNCALQMFEPCLPEAQMLAIQNLGFGTVDKIFLEYEQCFLNRGINEILLLWDDADMDNISKHWYRKLHSFSKISDTILMAWISGLQAEYMEEISDEVIAITCTEILSKFLLDPCIPRPIRVVRTTWHNQLYTQGSYSFIPVGASQADIKNLMEPVCYSDNKQKPALLFAGEATHPSYYSTTHGAFLSGKRAAESLVSIDKDVRLTVSSSINNGLIEVSFSTTPPLQCRCGSTVDARGLYPLSCKYSEGRFPRHGAINDIVKRALGVAGFPSQLESVGLDRGDRKRPDGLMTFPYKMGQMALNGFPLYSGEAFIAFDFDRFDQYEMYETGTNFLSVDVLTAAMFIPYQSPPFGLVYFEIKKRLPHKGTSSFL
ncbi:Spermine oxidase [Nymphon striatum]|nr:Spermine oxidase [Nymphon striatum]